MRSANQTHLELEVIDIAHVENLLARQILLTACSTIALPAPSPGGSA